MGYGARNREDYEMPCRKSSGLISTTGVNANGSTKLTSSSIDQFDRRVKRGFCKDI